MSSILLLLKHGFQGAPHGRRPERIHRDLEVLSQKDHLEIRHPAPLKFNVTNHVPRDVPTFELAAGGKLVLREAKLVAQTTHLRTNDVPGLGFHDKTANASISTHHPARVVRLDLREIPRNVIGPSMHRRRASKIMHPPKILESIYNEHGCAIALMAGTLVNLDVPLEDVDLLSRMPWIYPANRIAVERERLGVAAAHFMLCFKSSPPPPAWLTPAMIVKLFDLALNGERDEYEGADLAGEKALVLPA